MTPTDLARPTGMLFDLPRLRQDYWRANLKRRTEEWEARRARGGGDYERGRCAICGVAFWGSTDPWVHDWYGVRAHVFPCMIEQPLELWSENYVLQMATYDLPHECGFCRLPIATPAMLRRYYGNSLHPWCMPQHLKKEKREYGKNWSLARDEVARQHWARVMQVPVTEEQALEGLVAMAVAVETARVEKLREDLRWARVKAEARVEHVLGVLEKSPPSVELANI